ncbi:hypothetical protein ASPFODRAFT_201807 [Aspergillus luchuensis CBS 106.47]|uniref:Uncharacterized protein n=1 Tax=Aspergillus luchuensis (strain CBS 106.47) TaxID=1137211 RepID=A0A1M3TYW1_ASPLC|nr:hypothetical protein ASPFODRAFT_201807 [Aspergillus luchuensis CBS 106.47]
MSWSSHDSCLERALISKHHNHAIHSSRTRPTSVAAPFPTSSWRAEHSRTRIRPASPTNISFDSEHVYFNLREKDGTIPSTYRKLPYKARLIRSGSPSLILAHWLAPRRQGHVALVFDLEEGTVTVAALMPQKFELFRFDPRGYRHGDWPSHAR